MVFPWGALVAVVVVAAVATVSVVALVGFGIVGLSWRRAGRGAGGTGLAVVCLSAAAVVVAWGVARVIGVVP